MCQLNERAQSPCQCLPFETSEMRDTHVYLIRYVTPTLRSQPTEVQNLHRNSAAGLPKKFTMWMERHYGMAGMALSNSSPITLQMSVNVSGCVFMWNGDVLVFSLTTDSTFVYFNVLVWWKLQVSWCYCFEYLIISHFIFLFHVSVGTRCGAKDDNETKSEGICKISQYLAKLRMNNIVASSLV